MTGKFTTLSPNWNIPHVKAYTILALASDSSPVSFGYDNSLADDCRKRVEELINPEHPISWLRQVHGDRIVELPVNEKSVAVSETGLIEADGAYTSDKRTVCTVITADCLPVVFADQAGTRVGVAHAGRKGLQHGILFEMIKKIGIPVEKMHVWMGPGIAAESYPISAEIREEVLSLSPLYEPIFAYAGDGQYLMDLYEMARIQLVYHGIPGRNIDGAVWNTFLDKRFHSARRDKAQSGRMATMVWME